jgi:TM2 domain-containing membrane protein YozV
MENTTQSAPPQQTIVVVGKPKSVGVAILLAFFFGPLGLLYASVAGGIIMLILGGLIAIVTLGFGLIIVWVACVIWAVVAANNANKKQNVLR